MIKKKSVQNLSLRNNQIDDEQAKYISLGLGDIRRQNNKLLTLNLNGNLIGDEGAAQIARVSADKQQKISFQQDILRDIFVSKGPPYQPDAACLELVE